nr:ribonuclease H-like domain-containing protein [Tanacetum cinerariifolium]
MNYSSWVYYFSHLCHGYGILDHLVEMVASSSTATPTDPPSKDAEWTKINFIIRSWISSTLAPSLRNNDDVVTFALEGLPSTYETISTVISFTLGSCRFGDACKYLHNGVHGKSTLLPRTSGSASSVPDVTRLDLDMLQSLLAKLGLNAPNTFTPLLQSLIQFLSLLGFQVFQPNYLRSPLMGFRRFLVHRRGFTLYLDLHSRQFSLRHGFNSSKGVLSLDPAFDNWNMDTGGSSRLNDSIHCLCDILNMCIYPSVAVGDGRFILVTNSGHSVLSTPFGPLRLNNVLITPKIVKNLIFVPQFVRDNSCTVEFDPFGFSVKDFITRRVLLRCDSTSDLYPVTKPSTIPHAFLTSQYMWHQRLGHPGSEVLRRLVSSDSISCNKEKLPFFAILVSLFKCEIKSFQCDHGGEFDNHAFHKLFHDNDDSTDFISTIIRTAPITPVPALIHTPQPTPHPPPTPQSVPQIVPEHAPVPTNDSPTASIHPMVTRSRVGTTRPNPRYTGHVSTISPLPQSYKEAFNDPNCRYKARLVANCSTQVEGVDIDVTFSPVVKPGTIRTVLSLAISRHWPVHQLDVKNAFYMSDDTTFLLLYVDDIVLTASPDCLLQQIIASLHRQFSMTDLSALNYFLGISVMRDSSGMFLSHRKYAMEILERAHMVGCNPSRTPVDTESKVCLYMHVPREPYFSALKRILRYVQGTLDYGLPLFSSTTDSLIAYSDADWAGCPTTRRSTSGHCVFLGNNLLSRSSKRQPMLSRSGDEAEYRGVANAVAETCWIWNLLRELHTPLSSTTIVYCDNVSVVYLSFNPVQHQRTKHIDIDIHFVRDLVATGQVCVLHVPSRFQYADIFTKGLPSALFDEFRNSLSVRCTLAQTAGEY